ncbi:peroxisomal catalase 1 isoform X2 [Folsomia candida]|uniref:peroxisomal catalase 1 isoform X2 n=1 Tax=Folsomia candida TaxID=158441 RepID=UPI001604F0E3|nr:peroxisomal catalase 1 isoform X2 [Folsomia candida]
MGPFPLIFVLVLAITSATSQARQSSTPVTNPFLGPADFQLSQFAATHPNGDSLRTTDGAGNPLPSNTASLAISNRGPLLFDNVLANKLASFHRERIPERIVHAKGHGAFGHFVVTHDVSRFTKAKVFNRVGKITPVLVRFSGTVRESGGAETLPDPRGFAIRLYTEDGNLDFPGLQIDAFTLRDPMLFPDLIRSMKRNPETHLIDQTQFHDFLSLRPEVLHNYVKFFADSVRAGSSRGMNGSAVNVYECVNAQGQVTYCKFVWHTWQSIPPLTDFDTVSLAGVEPDFYTKELYNSIAQGNFPKWTFGLQVMTYDQAESLSFNPFDVTKVWRLDQFPFIPIGVFVLDKNPTDYFTQIEQAAFCPTFVPGIRTSPDRILQARAFAYKDAQRYRLGPNFELIEVNRPLSRADGYERDGSMRISAKDNGDGGPVYFPNSFKGPRIDRDMGTEGPHPINGIMARIDSRDEDNFSQPREYLEKDVGTEEKVRIATRIATVLASVSVPEVRLRVLTNCIAPLGTEFYQLVAGALQTISAGGPPNYNLPINPPAYSNLLLEQ